MKVLLFGPRGYLGQQFRARYPDIITSNADIADAPAVAAALDTVKPAIVINAAGKTGRPNVDWCEEHPLETIRGNVTGPLVLLDACAERGIYWVHLSSGCIYASTPLSACSGGNGSYTEEDTPNFSGSLYARSKTWAEQVLREVTAPRDGRSGILILRLRMPFDGTTNERNLLIKLRRYHQVLDAPNSLTYLPDFLTAARALIDRRKTGVYNIVNPGAISPHRIMELYREIVDPGHRFRRLTLDDLGAVVRAGRSNCILSTAKLAREGIELRPVEEAAREALRELKSAMLSPVGRG